MKYEQPSPEHVVDRRATAKPDAMYRKEYFRNLLAQFNDERWARCCRAMQIHVMQRDEDAAVATLKAYISEEQPRKATNATPLTSLLPDRVCSSLAAVGIYTVGDARRWKPSQLLELEQMGEVAVKSIREMLAAVARGQAYEVREEDLDGGVLASKHDQAADAPQATGGGSNCGAVS